MKTSTFHAKKVLVAFFAVLLPLVASAQKVEIDGIWYNLVSKAKQAEVTYKGDSYNSYPGEYSGSITIPATVTYDGVAYSVTSIGGWAFAGCYSLTAITLPEGVTSIGSGAFAGCSSLTSITIPEGVTSIGMFAFDGCSSLTAITLPEGVTSIGESAFRECSNLTAVTLPESLTSIGESAFYYCTSLTDITIPKGVTSIGSGAFSGCNGLTAINIPENSKLTSIGSEAFNGCSRLTAITLPEGVTSIRSRAFYECSSLTSITLPEGVTSIGEYAFYECSSLTAITLPEGVTSIGKYAFYECSSLYNVINYSNLSLTKGSSSNGYVAYYAQVVYQGDELTTVGDFQFYTSDGIHSLVNYIGNDTEIGLPDSYNGENYKIGDYAFYRCSRLTTIIIPEGVTSIGKSAFYDCRSLTSIALPASVTSIGARAFEGCSSLTAINIPESVTSIGDNAFFGCSSLTAINIPEGVTSIGDWAFSSCRSLTAITLPEGVTSIGSNAFWGCSSLTAINIPEGVTYIGERAFYGCSSLERVTINCENVKNWFSGLYSIKEIVLGEGVTSIGNRAFAGCSSLTAITIPEGVTSIGDGAFNDCTRLHTLTIGSNVSTIGTDAFKTTPLTKVIWLTNTPPTGYTYANGVVNYVPNNQYTNLKNQMVYPYLNSCFSVGGVTYVPNSTDKLCDVINCTYDSYNSSVAIDSTVIYHGIALKVNEIMPYAFYKNIHMNEITIDNGVGSIGEKAFYQCENISSITIGNGAEKIEAEAFYECKKLTNVTIGNGLKNINSKAFYGCGALKSFKVGRSLESIGDNAFFGCSAIEQFVCHAKQPPLCGEMAIYDIDKWNSTLKVPSKAVDRYKNADQWAGFFFTEGFEVKPNIVTFMVDGSLHETVEVEYGEEITLPATPEKEGHTFAGWTDMPTIMPSNDIVVHGEFAKNKYKVEFIIDGKVYHSDEILYGDAIELIEEPTKEGYTFSGWSEAPETMPAEDVTINGTFTINKYLVTFKIDDEVIASDSLEYGANIVAPEAPEKEGYTFNGWGNVAWKVPAHDLTYEGTYKVNSYSLRYVVDDMSYKTVSVRYGDTITLIDEPTKEGYEFSGWSEAPETMPAEDVTVTGTFKRLPSIYLTINQADNGCVKQHLVQGTSCTFVIEAAEGWKIHTVTFNGEDVTSQLTEEGTFTTPELQGDAVLNIAYEKIDDAIESTRAGAIKVQGHQGIISISGTTEGETIGLYTTSGTLVATATAEGESTHLTVPTGQVYIVKVADTVVKIGM